MKADTILAVLRYSACTIIL